MIQLSRCLGDMLRLLRLVVDARLLTRRAFSTGIPPMFFISSFSFHWQSCLLYPLLGELYLFSFPILLIAEPFCCAGWYVLRRHHHHFLFVSMMTMIYEGTFIITFSFRYCGSSSLLMPRLASTFAFTCVDTAPYTISKVKCMSPPPCTTLLAMTTMSWSWVSCYFGAAMMMFKHLPFSEN